MYIHIVIFIVITNINHIFIGIVSTIATDIYSIIHNNIIICNNIHVVIVVAIPINITNDISIATTIVVVKHMYIVINTPIAMCNNIYIAITIVISIIIYIVGLHAYMYCYFKHIYYNTLFYIYTTYCMFCIINIYILYAICFSFIYSNIFYTYFLYLYNNNIVMSIAIAIVIVIIIICIYNNTFSYFPFYYIENWQIKKQGENKIVHISVKH